MLELDELPILHVDPFFQKELLLIQGYLVFQLPFDHLLLEFQIGDEILVGASSFVIALEHYLYFLLCSKWTQFFELLLFAFFEFLIPLVDLFLELCTLHMGIEIEFWPYSEDKLIKIPDFRRLHLTKLFQITVT